MSRSTATASIAPRTAQHVALVSVGPDNPLEMQDVVSTTEKLRPIAEATGGTVRRLRLGAAARRDPARRQPEPGGQLRRKRLYRHQADRIERADRRPLDLARVGLLRSGAAARRRGRGVACGSRPVPARRTLTRSLVDAVDRAVRRDAVSRRAIDRVSRDQRSRLQPRASQLQRAPGAAITRPWRSAAR